MSARNQDAVIAALAAGVRPVTPLAAPGRRALVALALVLGAGGVLVALSDVPRLWARYAGREAMLTVEMVAIFAAGALGVAGAFFASIPGRSRLWLVAPLPFLIAWLLASCSGAHGGANAGGSPGNSLHCLAFITGTSVILAVPLVWRLSRAAPIDAMRVALLAGVGIAALSAFLLQFFHPFAVTPFDLCVHVATIGLVAVVMTALGRRTLGAA